MTKRYEVTHVPHYIGQRWVEPGMGSDSIVTLPEGVKPGRWLKEVGAVQEVIVAGGASGKYAAKHNGGGNWLVELVADGTRASVVFKKADGDARAKAEAEAERLNAGGDVDLGATDSALSSAQADTIASTEQAPVSSDLPDA